MKVINLIKLLEQMPKSANVKIVYDGSPRMNANKVFLASNGKVMITDIDEHIYFDNEFKLLKKAVLNNHLKKQNPID